MLVHFISLGCDKNLVDSEIMLHLLGEGGHEIVAEPERAQAIIVNTCAFIAKASAEAIETALEYAAYKASGECKALILTGCMAQRYKDDIMRELPEVDAIVGVNDFDAIGEVLSLAANGHRTVRIGGSRDANTNYTRKLTTPSHFAYLKISQGCDNDCTYCTIPSITGKHKSRSIESLLKEARMLADQGVRELMIVAQDTTYYGRDLGEGAPTLPILLNELSRVPGIAWLRLFYAYPEYITDALIEEMSQNPKICHYIDMPIQHCDDTILRRMGRARLSPTGSTDGAQARLLQTIAKLRAAMPDIALRTTLIVGFPGESDEQFARLAQFVREIRFDKLGIFEYSPEEGTPAAKLPDQVPDHIKSYRKDFIMRIQREVSRARLQSRVGHTYPTIVEGYMEDRGLYFGRTFMDAHDIDGNVFFEHGSRVEIGEMIKVHVTQSSDYDLTGIAIV